MKTNEKQIWFPAKKYGWGWGPPCAWQGWVVMAVFVVLLGTAGGALLARKTFCPLGCGVVILVTALMVTCFIKGEKPRWRWGKD